MPDAVARSAFENDTLTNFDRRGGQRYGYIPDLSMWLKEKDAEGVAGAPHARLLEVKTMVGMSKYRERAFEGRVVDKRSDGLMKDYEKKLHAKDVEWCGTARGATGPLQTQLQSHGALRGLVFGRVGEACHGVEKLLAIIAQGMMDSRRSQRALAGEASVAAVKRMMNQARRRLGMTYWRGLAQLILDRRSLLAGKAVGMAASDAGAALANAVDGPRALVRAAERQEAAEWQPAIPRG